MPFVQQLHDGRRIDRLAVWLGQHPTTRQLGLNFFAQQPKRRTFFFANSHASMHWRLSQGQLSLRIALELVMLLLLLLLLLLVMQMLLLRRLLRVVGRKRQLAATEILESRSMSPWLKKRQI